MEILGHVPWEFERMKAKVSAFEIEVGFAAEIVSSALGTQQIEHH